MEGSCKSGFAVLIGRPNVGKSTLMNTLIGQKIAITSDKPQTTRTRIQTVYTEERGQIVFLDTPGMIRRTKNRLGRYMVTVASRTLEDADVIIWLAEASPYVGETDQAIAQRLKDAGKPVILVLNKVDLLKNKDGIIPVISAFREYLEPEEIIPVSATKGTNTDVLIDAIFRYLPEEHPYFDEDTVTDQTMRQIASEIIREKALRLLSEEIPHGIAVSIDKMSERRPGLTDVEASIICERDSHKAIIIGKGGSMLKRIGSEARADIEDMMETQINLKIWVKVRENWRDSDIQMKNFGYDIKEI